MLEIVPFPRLRDRRHQRRPQEAARRRPSRPRRSFPKVEKGHAVERHEDRRCATPRRPRRRTSTCSSTPATPADQFAHPRHRVARDVDARRGHEVHGRAADLGRAAAPRRQHRRGLQPRHVLRRPVRAEDHLDRVAQALRRRHPHPPSPRATSNGCRSSRSRGSSARSVSPWDGAARLADASSTAGPRVRHPFTGSGTEDVGREDHARRPREVPPDLVQARTTPRWSSSATPRWPRSSRSSKRCFKAWKPGDVPEEERRHGGA